MCGRFSLTASNEGLVNYFGLSRGLALEPRYNIAPTQPVVVVRVEEDGRRLVLLRWGLVPFWASDPKIGYRMINARAETAHKTPAFRAAFRGRRCLIPASAFYEWDKKGGSRQPYYIRRADGQPLALAGLWEHWEEKDGRAVIESCTILTTDASEPASKLHDRMPAILEPEDFELWLHPGEQRVERLRGLLRPAPSGALSMYPVSDYVNKATHEGERCVEPAEKACREA
jgi:putative SOS response-associated peptidase YedK